MSYFVLFVLPSPSCPDFKQALVTPLIKKKTLCRNEFKNYRPISNLSFLSKILEKIVAKRLNAHIEEHLLSNHVQSAYKRFHSTETALLKIHNDIICNMDNSKVTALTLLDLSAAFDTIDHATLLNDCMDILAFMVQFCNGSNHTFQTDSNAFT